MWHQVDAFALLRPSTAIRRRGLVCSATQCHRPFAEWVLADVEADSDAEFIADAAESGSLELVKWLYGKGYAVGGDALANAAASGNVALCKWVSDHGLAPTQSDMEEAVVGGYLHVLEWLLAEGCSCTSEVIERAVRFGGVPVVAWCLDHHPHLPDTDDLLNFHVQTCRELMCLSTWSTIVAFGARQLNSWKQQRSSLWTSLLIPLTLQFW